MNNNNNCYTKPQLLALITCRVLIGWHFLYEGCVKLLNPDWSAKGFLMDSEGLFKELFLWMANTEEVIEIINFLTQWGLVFIGLALILGMLSKIASISGIIMLTMFYISHPPLIGIEYMMPSEGSYLIVNKNLIELSMLIVLTLIPTNRIVGIDRLLFRTKRK